MIYITRCRRLVKAVFYEQDRIDLPNEVSKRHITQFPLEKDCLMTFRHNNKKYAKNNIASKTLVLAVGAEYIRYIDPNVHDAEQRVGITGSGIRLLTFTGYLNEIAKSVSAFVPIIISLLALVVAVWSLVVD